MNRILKKTQLSDDVYRMEVEAPLIARERKPGQFIILQIDDQLGERIPLTIADADPAQGSITLIFQAVGRTTHLLADKQEGDTIAALLGPLGQPTHIEKVGHAVCVGGGIGVAPLHPIAQALKAAGNRVTIIIGARNRSLIILEEEMRRIADELIIVTDDGSYGRKALVTEPLKELCEQTPKPDLAVAIGPPIMMKFCAETTRPYGVHTVVSLNTIMIDGTGMCGGCRVTVGGKTKFVCVDGPEFDGHLVDFDNMMKRLRAYKPREDADHQAHHCRLDEAAALLTPHS
ncbi:MAG TPA: sulfide/dihydroorotate dehydrogenase-like FAD/NAD-binding protein [Kiritimatiellia bacterium]|jgi:ferredoxin--NADP+ reductase|nr:MAG: Dihydroorotate dehydrogenase B (NAD(+)), electron transfer subunit [Verrucomicrobia bacterium ADurb.Bin070]HPB11332.1 sulfide/dihydroorotate dehydrogenase-like FAD/NAD-binding protein [Kiritimatiellia bacterium]HPO38297.1 sulfide/dihydroorotate dehydrogenase-like FAD/NAD-binding protein [Kiritimatiellia bacterium]HQL49905.1 sulfide/dihydroorotate dehydrogenase-like FAD/NAD-binding protein [Kiritimatiellia bacterium]HQQ91253.1 sulfide/dihydroorotate dehydrogenase-like FAD/NAD-binding pro